MIYSIILLIYKSKNNLQGYGDVKYKLNLEIQDEIYELIIILSGENIKKWKNSLEGVP